MLMRSSVPLSRATNQWFALIISVPQMSQEIALRIKECLRPYFIANLDRVAEDRAQKIPEEQKWDQYSLFELKRETRAEMARVLCFEAERCLILWERNSPSSLGRYSGGRYSRDK